MKQVFLKNGTATLEEVPAPHPKENELLIQVSFSCISPGTERQQMADSQKSSYVSAIIEKPGRIKKAFDMIRTEGLGSTMAKVRGELDQGDPVGYSLVGTIVEMGSAVEGFTLGDRVACAGAENAFHAEYVCVPCSLTVRLPKNVDMDQASTVALGAIALQGVRRSGAMIGEWIGVVGLGALGQITAILLHHAGCKVIGFDLNPGRLKLAESLAFCAIANPSKENPIKKVKHLTKGYGVDAVIITAASPNSTPLSLAADICRKKGKVVVVGDIFLNLDRKDWYKKELDLLMSTSYGPGRYDPAYEVEGKDYPYAYVRWTEKRNMEAYLECLASGISISPLIRNTFPIMEMNKAFQDLEDRSSSEPLVLLQYAPKKKVETRVNIAGKNHISKDRIHVAIVGPGSFARDVHLPNLRQLHKMYKIHAIMGNRGHIAKEIAIRYGAQYATTNFAEILEDSEVDLVFITTRHDLHAPLAIQAAKAGKAVFMEKPMAISRAQLGELEEVLKETNIPFMVGFNRRFSPFILRLKEHLGKRSGPSMICYSVNAKAPPVGHWVHSAEGGGQLIGEGCHFVDLLNFLVDCKVKSFSVSAIHSHVDKLPTESNFQVALNYEDGSLANLVYTTLGTSEFKKEYLQAFFDGQVVTIDDYRDLRAYGSALKPIHTTREEKGHQQELGHLAQYLKGHGNPPIEMKEMVLNSLLTLEINEKLRKSEEQNIPSSAR